MKTKSADKTESMVVIISMTQIMDDHWTCNENKNAWGESFR